MKSTQAATDAIHAVAQLRGADEYEGGPKRACRGEFYTSGAKNQLPNQESAETQPTPDTVELPAEYVTAMEHWAAWLTRHVAGNNDADVAMKAAALVRRLLAPSARRPGAPRYRHYDRAEELRRDGTSWCHVIHILKREFDVDVDLRKLQVALYRRRRRSGDAQ